MATKKKKSKVEVLLLRADGSQDVLNDDSLPVMQKAVGGLVEPVELPSGGLLLVNEEGLLQNLPVNPLATFLAGFPIVGDAVFMENPSEGWRA